MTAFDASPTTKSPSSFGIARLAAALTTLASGIQFRAPSWRPQPAPLSERLARDAGEPVTAVEPGFDPLSSHGLSAAQVLDFISRDCRRGEG
jgi:hypothetical protein